MGPGIVKAGETGLWVGYYNMVPEEVNKSSLLREKEVVITQRLFRPVMMATCCP